LLRTAFHNHGDILRRHQTYLTHQTYQTRLTHQTCQTHQTYQTYQTHQAPPHPCLICAMASANVRTIIAPTVIHAMMLNPREFV
jgi:hypothetical protein